MFDLLRPIHECKQQHQDYLARQPVHAFDWEVFWILLSVAVLLTIQHYALVHGSDQWLVDGVARVLPTNLESQWLNVVNAPENLELRRNAYWAIGQIAVYTIIPLIVVFRSGRPLVDFGLKWRGAWQGWWIYALMFLVMLPAIWLASRRAAFLETYPFYKLRSGEPLWPRFIVWEVLYAGQFVALEFFFRGYLLHGTKLRFGPYAIAVMMVPYCMIHFGKPMPETFGAIGAGLILGYMSLKTCSIWMGAGLHIAVAWTMDTLAIWQRN